MRRHAATFIIGVVAAATAMALQPVGVAKTSDNALDARSVDVSAGADWVGGATNHWVRVEPFPDHQELAAIDCVHASNCMAVGTTSGTLAREALVMRWNGTRWFRDLRMRAFDDGLRAVACLNVHHCFATIHALEDTGGSGSWIVELRDGRWKRPQGGFGRGRYFTDIACARVNQCLATGYLDDETDDETSVTPHLKRWDGQSWHRVHIPAIDSRSVAIHGVDCVRVGVCWAVGQRSWGAGDRRSATLVLKYRPGHPVRVARSPTTSNHDMLSDVACVQAISCYAVGTGATTRVRHGLVLRLYDQTWSKTDVTGPHIYLNSVSCHDRTCYTVGSENDTGRMYAAGLRSGELRRERINQTGSLAGLSCFARQQCYAVGGGFPALVMQRH